MWNMVEIYYIICYCHKNKHVVLLILLIKNVVQWSSGPVYS